MFIVSRRDLWENNLLEQPHRIGSILAPSFWYRIPITDNFIIIMCDLKAKITLSCVNHIQLHIGFHLVYAVLWTFMVVVPLVTKPRDSGMGLLLILVTGIPYYMIFVKGNAVLRFLEGINREYPETGLLHWSKRLNVHQRVTEWCFVLDFLDQ